MHILETMVAKLALLSAKAGAGMASSWMAYQPKEPSSLTKNR